MTERQYEELGERMLAAYEEAEQEMLRRTANRLARGVNTPGWTEMKMAEMRQAREAVQAAMDTAHRTAFPYLSEAINTAYGDAQQRWIIDNFDAVRAMGIIHGNASTVAYILSDLTSRINAAERLVLRQYDDVYANVIGETSALVATGAFTQRQALNIAMQRFADKGVTGFVDKAGRHWNLSTYTEMALLTGMERAHMRGYVDTMESYGYDLCVLSSHAGSCPVCAAWEGVIMSASGDNGSYPSLDEAEAAGVFHPRCLHDVYTYYPGISHGDLRSSPREVEEPSAEYTARSEQRYMESNIRRYKRRMAAAVTPEAERQAYNHVKAWQKRLREHLAANRDKALPRKYWREGGRQKLRLQKGLPASQDDGTMEAWQKMLNSRLILKNADLKNGLPATGRPSSISDKLDDAGKVTQRRYYGKNGKAAVDYDTTNHNRADIHPTGAHKHTFDWNAKVPRSEPEALTADDLAWNSDIVQRGVNYFDP